MIWTLIPVSAIYGLAAALVLRGFSAVSVRRSIDRMIAHLMEFRLFIDSPALILRAQWDLIRENLHLMRLILWPCAILALTFFVLFPQLDAMYGHAALQIGEPTVVTVRMNGDPILEAPAGIEVETPGVHAVHDREVSWRVLPLGRVSGELRLRRDGRILTKQIVAGSGLICGWKLPFTSPAIEIRYPRAAVLGVNWMIWFFLISTAVVIGCGYRL